MAPECVGPVQSLLTVHLPQVPSDPQKGVALEGHELVVAIPWSPSHPTHLPVPRLQTGVEPVHAALLPVVHSTHWLLVTSQASVLPKQLASETQGSHLPVLAPLETHSPERHC